MPKFKLVKEYLYWWPVSVAIPDPDQPGKTIAQTFEMLFSAMPTEDAHAFDEATRMLPVDKRAARDVELIVQVSRDWRGVERDGGGEEAFSEESLRAALRHGFFRTGCYRAYAQSLTGEEPRLGN